MPYRLMTGISDCQSCLMTPTLVGICLSKLSNNIWWIQALSHVNIVMHIDKLYTHYIIYIFIYSKSFSNYLPLSNLTYTCVYFFCARINGTYWDMILHNIHLPLEYYKYLVISHYIPFIYHYIYDIYNLNHLNISIMIFIW